MLNSLRLYRPQILLIVTAAILAAVSFFRVHTFQDPTGGDGYFYLKQTEWLANHFRFYHADYSLVFLPLAFLYKITGSALLSYQALTCFNYFIILSACGFFVFRSLTQQSLNTRLAISASLIIALSFQMPVLRISFEFVKNGFALSLFLLAGFYLFKNNLKTALLLSLLSALSHKTLALVFLLSLVIFVIQISKYRKSILAFLIFFCISAFYLNPRLSAHLFSLLEGIRFERWNSLFIFNSHLIWSHLVLIFSWLIIFIFHLKKINKSPLLTTYQKGFLYTLALFAAIPLIPIYAGLNYEIKWRLMIFTFCFSFILYATALIVVQHKKLLFSSVIFSVILMSYEFFNATGFPWVAGWSHQAPEVQRLTEFVKPTDELITHHGMQFYVDYKTPIRAKSLLTPNALPKFQLAYIPEFYLLNPSTKDAVNQVKLVSVGNSYGLFYYEDFQALLKEFPYMADNKNTFKVRPDFVESYPSK